MGKQNRNDYQPRITKKDLLLGELIEREIKNPGWLDEATPDELVKICEMASVEGVVEYDDKGKLVQVGMKSCDHSLEAGPFHGGTEPRAGQFYKSNIKSRIKSGKTKKLGVPVFDFKFA